MGKKDEGDGTVKWVVILILGLMVIDYLGMYQIPVIHQINQKYVIPALKSKNLGGSTSMPTTEAGIMNLSADSEVMSSGIIKLAVRGGEIDGTFSFSRGGDVVPNSQFGVVIIYTIRLPTVEQVSTLCMGRNQTLVNEYRNFYTKVGGVVTITYYTDNARPIPTSSASVFEIKGGASTKDEATIEEIAKFTNSPACSIRGLISAGVSAKVFLLRKTGSGWVRTGVFNYNNPALFFSLLAG